MISKTYIFPFPDKDESISHHKKKAASGRADSSRLRKKVQRLEDPKFHKRIQKKGIEEFVNSKFKGKAQRRVLLTGKKRAVCDKVDICESLVIRALGGRKGYNHLRKHGPVYYPSIITQDRHLNGLMKCQPGYVLVKLLLIKHYLFTLCESPEI
jgi:hypothetical protein